MPTKQYEFQRARTIHRIGWAFIASIFSHALVLLIPNVQHDTTPSLHPLSVSFTERSAPMFSAPDSNQLSPGNYNKTNFNSEVQRESGITSVTEIPARFRIPPDFSLAEEFYPEILSNEVIFRITIDKDGNLKEIEYLSEKKEISRGAVQQLMQTLRTSFYVAGTTNGIRRESTFDVVIGRSSAE